MKLIKFFLILSILILPFNEIARIPLGKDLYISPLDVGAGITVFIWLILVFFGKVQRPQKILFLTVCAFPLFGVFSLLLNSLSLLPYQFIVAFLYAIRLLVYTLLFFLVQEFDQRTKRILQKTFFFVGLAIVIAGYFQYFFYSNLRNLYYLGWDEHLYRMFSTFLDPNFAGAFFVLYGIFNSALVYIAWQEKKQKHLLFYTIVLLVILGAVFLTYSRSALIMLVIAAGVYLFLIQKKKLLLILLGVILVMIFIFSSKFYIENTNLFRVNSSKARLETANNAFHIMQKHPLIGVGFNAYRYAQVRYGFRKENTPFPSNADAGVDNSWLFVLATTGILGFLLYLWFWKTMLLFLYQRYKKSKNIFAAVIFASICGLFINALFINSLFYAPFLLWGFVWLGIVIDK